MDSVIAGSMFLRGVVGMLLLPLGSGSAWWSFAAAVAGIEMAMPYSN